MLSCVHLAGFLKNQLSDPFTSDSPGPMLLPPFILTRQNPGPGRALRFAPHCRTHQISAVHQPQTPLVSVHSVCLSLPLHPLALAYCLALD